MSAEGTQGRPFVEAFFGERRDGCQLCRDDFFGESVDVDADVVAGGDAAAVLFIHVAFHFQAVQIWQFSDGNASGGVVAHLEVLSVLPAL